MNEQRIIDLIRNNQFKRHSALFLKVNRIAYVDARLWDEYKSKSLNNKLMQDLSIDALKEMIEYVDKSINVLRMIKDEADKLKGNVRTAALTGFECQTKMSDALKYYVKLEKDWQTLNDLADAIQRSGVAGQEQSIRTDLNNLFSDISVNALKAIEILKSVRSKALDELGI